MKKIITLLTILLIISGCSSTPETPEEGTEKEIVKVVKGNVGDYSILTPFNSSSLRQDYGSEFREIDMMEIGYQLLENTKADFDPNSYYIGEGTIIDRSRYHELVEVESEDNPVGLNITSTDGFKMNDGTVLIDPTFISDIVEINYYKNNKESLDGIAIALVLKRVQTLDKATGSTYRINDEDLFTIGSTIGLRLQSYLRSIDGLVDTPMYIGLYVQDSTEDSLPNRYLPGYYIGHSFSTSGASEFVKDKARWYYMGSTTIGEEYPQLSSSYILFKNNIMEFIAGENTSIVGKAFVTESSIDELQIQITTGAKTYIELYAISRYVASELATFDTVDVSVNIRISETTRFVITKNAGQEPVISKVV